MKLFLFGILVGVGIPFIVTFLYGIAVFLWGDWHTGEIWKPLKKRWRTRSHR